MKSFETIGQYYKEFGHTPPVNESFDVRGFEQYYAETASKNDFFSQLPFQVQFYGIGLLTQGSAEKHLGKPFDENLILYSPYQVLSFEKVERNWKGYYLMFDQDFLDRCSFGATFYNDFPFLRLDHVHPFKLSKTQVQELLSIFKTIYREFYSTHEDKFELIEIYLNLLLQLIKRFSRGRKIEDTDNRNKAEINLVSAYQRLVQLHLSKTNILPAHVSPQFYAEKLNIHPNHLNAVTKRVTGKTAKQVIQDNLLSIAKSILLQSTDSVKEIAYRLAFDDASHFINFFKKHTSLTPVQYRKIENF